MEWISESEFVINGKVYHAFNPEWIKKMDKTDCSCIIKGCRYLQTSCVTCGRIVCPSILPKTMTSCKDDWTKEDWVRAYEKNELSVDEIREYIGKFIAHNDKSFDALTHSSEGDINLKNEGKPLHIFMNEIHEKYHTTEPNLSDVEEKWSTND